MTAMTAAAATSAVAARLMQQPPAPLLGPGRQPSGTLRTFEVFVQARAALSPFPAREVVLEAERLGCQGEGVVPLAQVLYDVPDIKAAIRANQALFQRFTFGDPAAQERLLHAVTRLLCADPARVPRAGAVFKELYDLDLVEEEAFAAWAAPEVNAADLDAAMVAATHGNAAPFIAWLCDSDSDASEIVSAQHR